MLINYEITPPSKRLTTIESIKSGFDEFFKENGRYPTVTELGEYKYLPTSKMIERRFGGIKEIRKKLGLTDLDLRTGINREKKVAEINERGREAETKVYKYLIDKFGGVNIHKEYPLSDHSRQRMDFYVYNKKFLVEVFYPSTLRNFSGCLNAKLKKLERINYKEITPIYFIQMNESISIEDIEKVLLNKKNKISKNIKVMTFDDFKKNIG